MNAWDARPYRCLHTFTLYIEFYLVALIMFMVMQIYFFCQDVVFAAFTDTRTHCNSIILIMLLMMMTMYDSPPPSRLSNQMKMKMSENRVVRDQEKVYWIPIG